MKRCYFCGGKIVSKRIRHVHQWGDKIVLFENLEAEVCTQCGEVYLPPKTLEFIDKEAKEKPHKLVSIPVYYG